LAYTGSATTKSVTRIAKKIRSNVYQDSGYLASKSLITNTDNKKIKNTNNQLLRPQKANVPVYKRAIYLVRAVKHDQKHELDDAEKPKFFTLEKIFTEFRKWLDVGSAQNSDYKAR
jgi:hypothetical protein